MTATSQPAAASRWASAQPMKPAPPVIRTLVDKDARPRIVYFHMCSLWPPTQMVWSL